MDAALAGLAVLKVNWDTGHGDYIAAFTPFAIDTIRAESLNPVSTDDLSVALEERFGIQIPIHVLDTVLHRAVTQGYLEAVDRTYRPIRARIAEVNLDAARVAAERDATELTLSLAQYAMQTHQVAWSQDEAEAAIVAYLDEAVADLLPHFVHGRPLAPVALLPTDTKFIIGSFLLSSGNDSKVFSQMETVTKGAFLAQSVLYPRVNEVAKRLQNVAFALDTRCVLRALGWAGDAQRLATEQMMDLIREYGGRTICFEHTIEEVKSVLSFAAGRIRDGNLGRYYGETFHYFVDTGVSASTVELFLTTLDRRLKSASIHEEKLPEFEIRNSIDYGKLKVLLQEHVRYRVPEPAKTRDADSIDGIFRLRRGVHPHQFEESHAIFVTPNTSLARAAYAFEREEYPEEVRRDSVPLVMSDRFVTTLLWLKNPNVAPEMPKLRLLADAYAALNPDDSLWLKYLDEGEVLSQNGTVSADQYALRLSLAARAELMSLTHGNVEAYAVGTAAEVVRRAERRIRADEATQHQGVVDDLAKEIEQIAAREAFLRQAQDRTLERIQRVASAIAWGFVGFAVILTFALLALATVAPVSLPSAVQWLVRSGAVLTAILGALNLAFGTTVRDLASASHRQMTRAFVQWSTTFLSVTPSP